MPTLERTLHLTIKHFLTTSPSLNREGSNHKYFHQLDHSIETANCLVDAIYLNDRSALYLSLTLKGSEVIWSKTLTNFTKTGISKHLLSRGPEYMTERGKWKFLQALVQALGGTYYLVYDHSHYYIILSGMNLDQPIQISPKYIHRKSAINFTTRYQIPIHKNS